MSRRRRSKVKIQRCFKFPHYITNCTYVDKSGKTHTKDLNNLSADLTDLSNAKAFARAKEEVVGMAKTIDQNYNGRAFSALLKAPLLKAYAFAHKVLEEHGSTHKPHLFQRATYAVSRLKVDQRWLVANLFTTIEGPTRGKGNGRYHNRNKARSYTR